MESEGSRPALAGLDGGGDAMRYFNFLKWGLHVLHSLMYIPSVRHRIGTQIFVD